MHYSTAPNSPPQQKERRPSAPYGLVVDITIGNIVLTARDVLCGNELAIQHLKAEAPAAHLTVPLGSGPSSVELTVTLMLTEPEINRVLSAHAEGGLRDPRVALMNGSLRVTGRVEVMGPIAVPFALVGVPEVEGGERVRLQVRDVSVVGAALPGFSAQMVGERINAKLAEVLNVRRLGLPVRLVGVDVETGRLKITAQTSLEWNPAERAIVTSSD